MHRMIHLSLPCLVFGAVVLSSCGTYKTSSQFEDPNGNFHFHVYMDSYRYAIVPMDLKVFIDGRVAVDRNFSSSKGHYDDRFRFDLPQGTHTLKAVTRKGNAEIERTFEVKERNFAVLYFTPSSRDGEGGFSFKISDEPIYVKPGGGLE